MVGLHISRASGSGAVWIRLHGELDLGGVEELADSLSSPSSQAFVVDVSTLRNASDAALAALANRLREANVPLQGMTRHQARLLEYLVGSPNSAAA